MSDSIQRSAAVLYQMEEETPGLKESAQALVSDTMLWPALNGTGATREEKEELIRTAPMLAGKEQLTAFVLLLLEQGTLDSLPAILRELRQLELAAQGGAVCVVTCARQPDEATLEDLRRAVCRLRGLERVVLQIKIDPAILGGFRLEVQGVVYDRSVRGRLERLAQGLKGDFDADSEELEGLVEGLKSKIQGFEVEDGSDMGSLVQNLKTRIQDFQSVGEVQEIGRILSVGDGIAQIQGLDRAVYGELVEFETGVQGMVMDLSRNSVGCVLLGQETGLREGSIVTRTGRPADVPVGEAMLGRVVDALGQPLDGMGPIRTTETRPIEHEASGVISREPVNAPLQTGILAIDAMIPIGRGQRELLIGDRQTGKTAIAVDTILNQKGEDVICIYVAIGQKASSVARVRDTLQKHGAMDYSIIVSATASDPAPLQYIAPYAGAAMGEYFMSQGKDVLIVYDDLSKHAVAYRALSLLLKRSPGRRVLSPLPPAGAGLPPDPGVRRGFHDGHPHHRDPGGGRVRLYPHQRHLHHRRTDLSGDRPVLCRAAAGGECGPVGVPCGRSGPDPGHQAHRGHYAHRPGPLPGAGDLYPVLLGPRSGDPKDAGSRQASAGTAQAAPLSAHVGQSAGRFAVHRDQRAAG